MELTEPLKNHLRSKLSALENFVPSHAHVRAEIGRPSTHHKTGEDIYLAEIEVDALGHTYFIQVTDGDQYTAIDRASAEILEMIKSGKGRRQTMLRRGRGMVKDLMRYDFMGSVRNIPKKIRNRLSAD